MTIDKAEKELLDDKNTVVIIPEIGKEYQYTMKFLQKNTPRVVSDQRVFTELDLGSLQTDITVVVVAREFSNPLQISEMGADNMPHYFDRPFAELEEEQRISKPVKVSKYWVRDNPMRPGKPDTAGILEALAKECLPWRLDFVDKGEDKPQILKLQKV